MTNENIIGIDLGGKNKTWACRRLSANKIELKCLDSVHETLNYLKEIYNSNPKPIKVYIDGTLSYALNNERDHENYKRNFRDCDLGWHSYVQEILSKNEQLRLIDKSNQSGNWVSAPNSMSGSVTAQAAALVMHLYNHFKDKIKFIETQPRVVLLRIIEETDVLLRDRLKRKLFTYKKDKNLNHFAMDLKLITENDILTIENEDPSAALLNSDQIDALTCLACHHLGDIIEEKTFPDESEITFIQNDFVKYLAIRRP